MTISRDEAGAMLVEVDSVIARVKQSRIYQTASVVIIFWGVLVIAGNLLALAVGRWAGYSWFVIDVAGMIATAAMLTRSRRGAPFDWRLIAAPVLFFVFGLVWSVALGGMRARELDAFWPTLFLFGYALAGLWFGRLFTALGVGLAALVVAGYFWAGAHYELFLAVVNGGGLILCGLGMRRA